MTCAPFAPFATPFCRIAWMDSMMKKLVCSMLFSLLFALPASAQDAPPTGIGYIPGMPLPTNVFIALAMVVFVAIVMKKTSIGLFIQSVGINPTAAKYVGINVTMVLFLVYAFSGFCAGVTGLIESSLIRAADANNAGLNMEMDAILAVALGGTLLSGGKFYLGGSVIGAITIQTLTTTLYALGVSADQLPVVKAVAVIAICLIQSRKARDLFEKWKNRGNGAAAAGAKAVNKA